MPLVHVDILTPKQVLFFAEVVKALKRSGYGLLLTTRRYREVNEMLGMKRVEAVSVGEHGGPTREGKLKASLERTVKLSRLLEVEKPDVSLSFSSPEAARASFGLAIPHVCINDSPHAVAVAKLTVPLSVKLLTPHIIPKRCWLSLGATENMLVRYRAVDPVVWLRNYPVDKEVLGRLNIPEGSTLITVRPEETYASYLLDKLRGGGLTVVPTVKSLLKQFGGSVQFVVLPRYMDQASRLRGELEGAVVAEQVVDGPSLLSFSSVFIGAGGTMTAEAALLGVPTFSCYPGELTYVERYLIRHRLVYHTTSPEQLTGCVAKTIRNLSECRKIQEQRAKTLLSKMEDPVKIVVNVVSSYV